MSKSRGIVQMEILTFRGIIIIRILFRRRGIIFAPRFILIIYDDLLLFHDNNLNRNTGFLSFFQSGVGVSKHYLQIVLFMEIIQGFTNKNNLYLKKIFLKVFIIFLFLKHSLIYMYN